jgi:hypothetical protein
VLARGRVRMWRTAVADATEDEEILLEHPGRVAVPRLWPVFVLCRLTVGGVESEGPWYFVPRTGADGLGSCVATYISSCG